MYERFTDRARSVMKFARTESQRLAHKYIGTEHILLGLIEEGTGVGINVLKNLGIDLAKARMEVENILQRESEPATRGQSPQSPLAKKAIEYAMDEARNLNHNYLGTEHLLLGLLRAKEGTAGQVLIKLGLRVEDARNEIVNLLGPAPSTVFEGRTHSGAMTLTNMIGQILRSVGRVVSCRAKDKGRRDANL